MPLKPEEPRVTLEVTPHRCQEACMEASLPPGHAVRPLLVKVCLNEAAKVRDRKSVV